MRPLSSAELVSLWEQGTGKSAIQQAMLLLSACLERPEEELARLSIGQRDAHLLTLRAMLFGSGLTSIATCPVCGQKLELHINIDELCPRASIRSNETLVANQSGYEAVFRLPTTLDLAELRPEMELAVNWSRLYERCLLCARQDGADIAVSELPEEMFAEIARRMAEADPYADIQFDTNCPHCQHAWGVVLDIGSFLWSEIDAWAKRLLHQVHLLASAYGWSENDIVRLGATRRQFYLNLVGT